MKKFYKPILRIWLPELVTQLTHPFSFTAFGQKECSTKVVKNSHLTVDDQQVSFFKTSTRRRSASALLFLMVCFCLNSFAQKTIHVGGTVTDASTGKTLPGVSIKVKNSTVGISTDINGKYAITVDANSVLLFSFIGYSTIEKKVNGPTIDVQLRDNPNSLNEVVVVGYGSSSKTNMASATSTVSAKEFKDAVITNVDQALQGRASGVQVTELSGQPGTDAVIRIRGNNSLSGDNQPLYVIDGFPVPPYVEAGGEGTSPTNGLYGLNPNDIESMVVLKDAAATAIYGSRGANGVILIKTKSGNGKDQKIEYVNKTTFGVASNPYQMMNSKEFADVVNQGFGLQGLPSPFSQSAIDSLNSSTDWYKAITRTAVREDNTLNISGGSEKTNYYLSGDYLSDKGTVLNSQNNRASIRVNVNSDVNSWYSVKEQLSLTRQRTARAITLSGGFPGSDGVILDALRASPIVPVDYSGYHGEGIPGYTDGNIFSNPVTELQQKTDNLYSDFTVFNVENDFKIYKDLKLVINLGTNQNLSQREVFFPATTSEGFGTNGSGVNNETNTYSYNANAYLDYRKEFNGGHNLNITAGAEYNKETVEELNTATSGFDIPSFGIYNNGSADIQSTGSFKEAKVIQSLFLRTNYTYKDRYVLNASVRYDGASPFAENKKYGVFPAVGLAWNLNNETFMKSINWLTNTKIRASYGETGSQAIQPYSSLAQYGNAFYQTGTSTVNTVLYPASLGNANLSWERTKQFDAGVDFSVIKNVINVSFDYYNKETDGLLEPRSLPTQTGFGSVEDNYGAMQNRGVEVTVGANIVSSGAIHYSTKVTFSHNKNTLLNLGDLTSPQYVSIGGNLQSGVSGILQPGKEIGLFYGYKTIGLVQTGDIVDGVPKYPYPGAASGQIPGEWKFQDLNKDGTINTSDMQVLGKSNPDFTYGWNNDISYKNFSLNLFFTGSQGNSIVNLTRFYLSDGTADYSGIFFNQTQSWYTNRWTPTNPTNDPRYPGIQKSLPIADLNSSYLENGSYFRLKSATITYNLPKTKVLKNARIFLTGTNIFTITKYTGADPEIGSYGQSLLQQGIDYGAYASYRTYTIGVSASF